MSDNHKIVVSIYGSEYSIKGGVDKEYIEKLADYVDQRMREIADQTKIASTQRLAVLTALYIADELFSNKKEVSEADYTEINNRLQDLINSLDIETKI